MSENKSFISEVIQYLGSIQPSSWLKGMIYGMLMAVLYYSSFLGMIKMWDKDDFSYCYLIPFIVLYLLWEKRKELINTPSYPTKKGFFLFFIGLTLFWLGELGGEFYTLYISQWFVLVSLLWIHLGWNKLKTIAFPILFIISMYPLPSYVYSNMTLKLKLISSQIGLMILQVAGMSANREGNVIDLGFTQLQVVDACSGLRYLFPLIVVSILIAYFSKVQLWKKTVLVLSSIPISILVNSLRIASVGFLFQFFGPMVAEGFFHDFSGWLIFICSICILMIELWLLKKIGPSNGALEISDKGYSDTPEEKNMKAFQKENQPQRTTLHFVKNPTFIFIVAMLSITLIVYQQIDFREKIPIKKNFDLFPLEIGNWQGTLQHMEERFIDVLHFDDYKMVNYTDKTGKQISLYIAYYQSQRKGESIHSPATCLPGGGWIFKKSGETRLPFEYKISVPMTVNRAFMEKSGQRQLVYYWFSQRGRILTNIFQLKFYVFWDALTRQRTDGALVRIITPVYGQESNQDVEERLSGFTKELTPILSEFIPD